MKSLNSRRRHSFIQSFIKSFITIENDAMNKNNVKSETQKISWKNGERRMYPLHTRKTEWQRDGRASPYEIETTTWKTKGAPIIISVEINGKLRRKKRAHILNQARAHTFLTLCPIFGISQISKITHLVSGRGNPTKKPRLPSLKN